MADDASQDQTQTTTVSVQQPSVSPTDQQPATEQQQTTPVSSEVPNTPNPQSIPNQEPVIPTTSEPLPSETKTETPVPVEPQASQTEQPLVSSETQPSVFPPVVNIPVLHYPFSGNFPVTFSFGQQSDNEEIKKKFQEWGVVGHNGLDFGLSAGNEVFACDPGKVIQSGDNGDFGTSVTIQHSWGQSIYGHLRETNVKEGEEIPVNRVIGLSGSSGAAFGEHLHFAIKPNNPDINNGYLGFIDPAPYLSLSSQKEEQKPPEITQPVQEPPKPEENPQPPVEKVPLPIKLEPEKPIERPKEEQPKQPGSSQSAKTSQPSAEEIKKLVDEKLKVELDARRQKANEARAKKKTDNLNRTLWLTREKKVVTNDDVRDFLHISQSTATNYLTELVNRGMLKREGERGGTKYTV